MLPGDIRFGGFGSGSGSGNADVGSGGLSCPGKRHLIRDQHRRRVHTGQGLRPHQDGPRQPEHQHVRLVPLPQPDPGRADLHRPSGPGARGESAPRHQLAPDHALVFRVPRQTEHPLRHHLLVAGYDPAGPRLRLPLVHRQQVIHRRDGHGPQPDHPLDAGLAPVLGRP